MAKSYKIFSKGKSEVVRQSTIKIKSQGDDRNSVLIAKFRGGLSDSLKRYNNLKGLIRLQRVIGHTNTYYCYFKKMSLQKMADLCMEYSENGLVDFIQPYVLHKLQNLSPAFNDPLFNTQWYLLNTGQIQGTPGEDIKIIEAYEEIAARNIQLSDKGIIAILDEGVDITHSEFHANDIWYRNFTVFNPNSNNPMPKVQDDHGTMIAGIIAALQKNNIGIVGINQFSKIMAGKLYYTYDSTYVDPVKLAYGINRAVDEGARVINLSWAISRDNLVARAIERGFDKGVVFCVAAGNYTRKESNKSVCFPGDMNEVITVSAIDNRGEWIDYPGPDAAVKFGSCFGPEVDIAAPGVFITTTKNNNRYTYNFLGTSAATAIVSAVAGLVIAINPNLTNISVRNILLSTTDMVNDNHSDIPYFHKVGHGKLNAYRAIKAAINSLPKI